MDLDDLTISTGTFSVYGNPTSNVTIGPAPASTLVLNGENADIQINDISLTDVLKNIEQRLNILRPNTELEAEWHQLRELGDQYRRLEAELKEKSLIWNKLSAVPRLLVE